METQKTSIMKVRWCLRFKGPFGWDYVWNNTHTSIRYWDSFTELSKCVAERIDANPEMQFQINKETYYVKA